MSRRCQMRAPASDPTAVGDLQGMSDEQLVGVFARARDDGDRVRARAAWELLVVRSVDRVRTVVRAFRFPGHPSVTIPRDEVEDVTQDALLRVLRKLTLRGSSIGEFRAAVVTVARYQCQDHCRAAMSRDKHLAGSLEDTYEGDEGPVSRFNAALGRLGGARRDRDEAARDDLFLLRAVLPELASEDQRAVLRLTMEGHSSREIADTLGFTPANVDQLRKRGIDNLRRMLGDDAP